MRNRFYKGLYFMDYFHKENLHKLIPNETIISIAEEIQKYLHFYPDCLFDINVDNYEKHCSPFSNFGCPIFISKNTEEYFKTYMNANQSNNSEPNSSFKPVFFSRRNDNNTKTFIFDNIVIRGYEDDDSLIVSYIISFSNNKAAKKFFMEISMLDTYCVIHCLDLLRA